MHTFFRRFRKAFLDSGSVVKYLLYAVGEIALVVIGILIPYRRKDESNFNVLNALSGYFLTIFSLTLSKSLPPVKKKQISELGFPTNWNQQQEKFPIPKHAATKRTL